tara:strand:+ start:45702 stop:46178 length:477 start_codon:yes stop_codon:yes gene_type:complete
MSVQLRSLNAGDRPRLEAILRSDDTFRDDEVSVALELVDDALADPKSDYWFRLAERAGEPAGYICFGPTPMTACTYDLYWIVVHAEHRGRGIARALIDAMEVALRQRGTRAQIRVETSQSEGYGAARKLYDALGYPETARFKDFYSEGDDLIVFYKNL